jgi:hypothetical protein
MIEIHPLSMIGEVRPGDDRVALLGEALADFDKRRPRSRAAAPV